MSDTVLVAIITLVSSLLTAVISAISLFRVNKIEHNTNSITTKLGEAKYKEGEKDGIKGEQDRTAIEALKIEAGVQKELNK